MGNVERTNVLISGYDRLLTVADVEGEESGQSVGEGRFVAVQVSTVIGTVFDAAMAGVFGALDVTDAVAARRRALAGDSRLAAAGRRLQRVARFGAPAGRMQVGPIVVCPEIEVRRPAVKVDLQAVALCH